MSKFRVNHLEYAQNGDEVFETLEDAVAYHMKVTKFLDAPIGIWYGEDLVAIGYMWEVFYKKDET